MFYLEAFEAHPLTTVEGVALGCVKVMFRLSQPQSCQSWLRVGALKLVFIRASEAASTSDAHMRNYKNMFQVLLSFSYPRDRRALL